MEIIKTKIKDLLILKPKVHNDGRGYFMESFNFKIFKELFPDIKFIQDNESKSSYGVLRGLHFQKPPYEQTKLVRVVKGCIMDVVVDLRTGSDSFGKHEKVELSEKNKHQLLVPKGFAHGFIVLSKYAIVNYKVDNFYSKNHEMGIIFNDPSININWVIKDSDFVISKKDRNLVSLDKLNNPF
mgnify:FL=1